MPNLYEKELGVPLPQCCNQGSCCKGASPSTPYHQLLKRASEADDFARGFFSIMVPYASHQDAENVVPGIVERTLVAAQKQDAFESAEDIVFYQCRYQTVDNRCGVWEDRPQFCRDYPDTPFVVMAPGCAFEPWAKTCKEKYFEMKAEVARLKGLKEELETLKAQQSGDAALSQAPDFADENKGFTEAGQGALQKKDPIANLEAVAYGHPYTKIDALFCGVDNTENLSLVLSLTPIHVASPLSSLYFIR